MLYDLKTEQERKDFLLELLEKSHVPVQTFPYYWLCSTDFFRAPASRKYHAAYEGGLFEHSMNVAWQLVHMTLAGVTSPWSRPESPMIIGVLHDVTKIGLYAPGRGVDPDTGEQELYIKNPEYKTYGGHGADSVLKLKEVMMLTPEEEACIRYHMGAFETADWEAYGKIIKQFPNVLWTHTADMYAAKVMEANV
jgi:hypothetical protein|nr:MAG TPA: putative helicase [Podoviridae sp. ctgHy19]